jgi:hypothetical protein
MRTRKIRRSLAVDRRPAAHYYFTKNAYLSAELAAKSLYFGSPLNFNDPLDCDFTVVDRYLDSLSHAELERLRRGTINEVFRVKVGASRGDLGARLDHHEQGRRGYYPAGAPQYLDSLARAAEGSTDTFRAAFRMWVGETLRSMGIKCFTQRWDHDLMWAHYGSGHRGVCVGVYEAEHLLRGWRYNVGFLKVRYVNQKKIAPSTPSLRKLVREFMSLKFEKWSYEQEGRLLSFRGGGMLRARPSGIREVILGSKWFDLPCANPEAAVTERSALIEQVLAHRRLQPATKLKIYIAATDPETSAFNRQEVPDEVAELLRNYSSWAKSAEEALKYLNRPRYLRPSR